MSESQFPFQLSKLLEQRKQKGILRQLKTNYPSIDFSGNDYLGFSSQGYLLNEIKSVVSSIKTGSSGSRLISGNSTLFSEVEQEIASFHHAESALIYNSGYDANLGLMSSVPQKGDLILSDELIHASLIDGIRLSYASHYKFKHNDLSSLCSLVNRYRELFNEVYVVVESVYSMDGDLAPLTELVKLCKENNLRLIVDEAHAIGVFGKQGRGLCNELNIEQGCFARIYTYGKAMGCHGASIVGSTQLKEFLINFSRSFIYTTAMPEHSLLNIKSAYQLLTTTNEIDKLKSNITYFKSKLNKQHTFIESQSAIQCMLLPGNSSVQQLEEKAAAEGVFIKSIKSPTVKEGQERIRICMHSFNTEEQMLTLCSLLFN